MKTNDIYKMWPLILNFLKEVLRKGSKITFELVLMVLQDRFEHLQVITIHNNCFTIY